MLDFWGNEDLIKNINLDLKNNKVPHCQLIDDHNGNGGMLLGLKIAEKLLGKSPLNHPDFNLYFPLYLVSEKCPAPQDPVGRDIFQKKF